MFLDGVLSLLELLLRAYGCVDGEWLRQAGYLQGSYVPEVLRVLWEKAADYDALRKNLDGELLRGTKAGKFVSLIERFTGVYDQMPVSELLAAVLNEIAEASHCGVLIDEDALPIREEVRGVCDILGFDPLYLANEGKCIAFVPAEEADEVLAVMRENPYGKDACLIGEVTAEAPGQVGLRTAIGGIRIVDMPLGNLVPRIC